MTNTSIYKTPEGQQVVMQLYDKLLARWPVPYEPLTVSTRHGDTFVIASGEATAPPLILLHGAGTNSAIWGNDVERYSQQYRVYAVDLIGEAGKSAPNRPAWEGMAYAEWLEDVFDGLHIDRATITGISQGGWTALKFAVNHPEQVAKLVLICPGGVVPDKGSFLFKAILFSLLGDKGTRRLIQLLYGKQPIPDGVEDVITTMMSHFKGRMGKLPIFNDDQLRRLTMPTLLIGGTDDPMRDMDQIAARLQSLLPDLQVEIIPGAGHVVMNTLERITAFLRVKRDIPEMTPVP